jgi:hypothetical protein
MKFGDEDKPQWLKSQYEGRPQCYSRIKAIRAQINAGGSIYEKNPNKPDEDREILVKFQYVENTGDEFEFGLFDADGHHLRHTDSGDDFSNIHSSYVAVDWKYAEDCFL